MEHGHEARRLSRVKKEVGVTPGSGHGADGLHRQGENREGPSSDVGRGKLSYYVNKAEAFYGNPPQGSAPAP